MGRFSEGFTLAGRAGASVIGRSHAHQRIHGDEQALTGTGLPRRPIDIAAGIVW